MKSVLLSFISFFLLFAANAQKPFITIWNTANPGATKSNEIFLNATGTKFNVSWVNMANSADTNHTTINGNDTLSFASSGIYKVYITPGSGSFSAIKLFSESVLTGYHGDNQKLLSIEQWGDIAWRTFDTAFAYCQNMVMNATDIPNLAAVSNMFEAFFSCSSLTTNPAMANWDVSNVTDMRSMFALDTKFNQSINNWNVSNVTTMNDMFGSAYAFNQPLDKWNVGNVTDMTFMFFLAYSFNQPINSWDVSKVDSMQEMFDHDTAFNQPLNNWNVSNVTIMLAMFDGAIHFNQPIGNWNVSKVTNMSYMFEQTNFNQPLNSWNVSNVTNMSFMFDGTPAFNQPLSNWNTSNVSDMGEMFGYAKAFNQPIGNWNVSKVTDMAGMFTGTQLFNQPLANWNVSNVAAMNAMFYNAVSFNQPIGNWNTGNVTDMSYMFGQTSFNQPIGNWNTSKVANMTGMFASAVTFNQAIDNWDVSHVTNNTTTIYTPGMGSMFYNANAFNQNLGSWNLSGMPGMKNMFDSSGMSCNNYSATLKGWADSPSTPNNLSFGAANLTYDSATAKAAHDSLTNIKGWAITGDKIGMCSSVMPVNFLSFTAKEQNNSGLLNWSVAQEINVKGYTVEKSANGLNFNAIGFVSAKGSAQKTAYDYVDNNLSPGTNYYRIKEMDNDGKTQNSIIQKIDFSKFAWKVNGNPINNSSLQLMLDKTANVSVQIISSTGIVIKTINKGTLITGSYNIPLHMDNLTAGIYLVRLTVNDDGYVSTVIK